MAVLATPFIRVSWTTPFSTNCEIFCWVFTIKCFVLRNCLMNRNQDFVQPGNGGGGAPSHTFSSNVMAATPFRRIFNMQIDIVLAEFNIQILPEDNVICLHYTWKQFTHLCWHKVFSIKWTIMYYMNLYNDLSWTFCLGYSISSNNTCKVCAKETETSHECTFYREKWHLSYFYIFITKTGKGQSTQKYG